MPRQSSVGFLHGQTPYLRVGDGPPLVMIQGLTPDHDVPHGAMRRMALAEAGPLADDFDVYVVNRRKGLVPGESMSSIAAHVVDAIEHDIGGPVFLTGTSTGGSVALQLAVDRPDLVRRLVVVAAAFTLGPRGRALQADMARLIRAGEPQRAWSTMMSDAMPPRLRRLAGPLTWLMGRVMAPEDPSDALVTIDAEDGFDVEADLSRVTAPTLVIGGARDPFYPEELFRRTAAGVPDGRVHIFPTWGHLRTSSSTETRNLILGFMLAGLHDTPGDQDRVA